MNNNILYDYAISQGFNPDELMTDYFDSSEEERLGLMNHMQSVMQAGGQVPQENGQQDEIMQIVQFFSKLTGQKPEEIISQLEQAPQEQQQQMLQQMAQVVQEAQSSQQVNPEQVEAQLGYDAESLMGYRDDSPFKNRKKNLIKSPFIDMNQTSQRLLGISDTGDTKIMEPYSGQYEFDGNSVLEIPYGQTNANLQKIDSLKKELIYLNSKKYLTTAEKERFGVVAKSLEGLIPKLDKVNKDPATGEIDNSTGYWDRVLNKKRGSGLLDPRAQLALEKVIPGYGASSDGIIDYLSEATQVPQKELNNLLTGYYESPSTTINRYKTKNNELSKTQAFLTDVVTDPLIVEEVPEYAGKYALKAGKYAVEKAPVVAKVVGKAAKDAALATAKQFGKAYDYVRKVAPEAVEFIANNIDKVKNLSRFKTAIFKINDEDLSEQEAIKLLNDAKNDIKKEYNIDLSSTKDVSALSKALNSGNSNITQGSFAGFNLEPTKNEGVNFPKSTPTTFDNYLNSNKFLKGQQNKTGIDPGPIPTVAFLNGFKGNKKPDARAVIKGKETDLVKQPNGTYSADNGLNYNWDPNSRKFVSTGNTAPQIVSTNTPKGTGKNNRFSDAIRREQEFLKSNGFPDIKVDGILGPKTLAARNAYHAGAKPAGAKTNSLLPPDIVDDGTNTYGTYDSPNTINLPDAERDRMLGVDNKPLNEGVLDVGLEKTEASQLTNPTYGFKTNRLFNNLMNNYKLSKAFEPISLPYMPSVDYKAVDAPFIDPRGYIQNIRDQFGQTTANINSNSTTGQAALSNLAAKQAQAEQNALNEVSTRNQTIDYQNKQQRANLYNQIFNQRNSVNSNYTNQLQQTIANSDYIKDNALSNYQTLQNQYVAEDNAYDQTLAFTPYLSDASTIFDKILGNKKYSYDRIGVQADLEKQNKLIQEAYEAGLKAAKV